MRYLATIKNHRFKIFLDLKVQLKEIDLKVLIKFHHKNQII
jgi:hypothetical protein